MHRTTRCTGSTRGWCSSRGTASTNNWSVNGHDTVQLQNYGNYEGEATNTPGDARRRSATIPEPSTAARNYPLGGFRTSSATACGCGASTTRRWRGRHPVVLGPVAGRRRASPTALDPQEGITTATQRHILKAAAIRTPRVRNHTCSSSPSAATEIFPAMGCSTCRSTTTFRRFESLTPWIKFDLYNLFNNDKADWLEHDAAANPAAGVDAWVSRTRYTKTRTVGKATGNTVNEPATYTGHQSFPRAFNRASRERPRRPHGQAGPRLPVLIDRRRRWRKRQFEGRLAKASRPSAFFPPQTSNSRPRTDTHREYSLRVI